MIKKIFSTKELLQLVTSNFFSVLYYNSEIWHLPTLKTTLKKKLLPSSACAIKTCVKYNTNDTSFERLHEIYERATPEKYLLYKTALSLYKLHNSTDFSVEWAALNLNQILTSRQTNFLTLKPNLKRVGISALASRFYILNGKIDLNQFNKSFLAFKLQCKKDFLLT